MTLLIIRKLLMSASFLISIVCVADPFTVEVKRTSFNSSSLTGELFVNGEFLTHTLELPWNNNRSFISSIPAGTYSAFLRYDKNDKWRLQLENVPNRSGVQIHIGNWPSQIEGCVLVGNKAFNVTNELKESSEAYRLLKKSFYGTDNPSMTPDLTIKVKISYHPGRTIFSNSEFKMSYQDEGRWSLTSHGDSYNFKEVYRDGVNVYLFGMADGENIYVRTPLFGGTMAQSLSISGPWSIKDMPVVSRQN